MKLRPLEQWICDFCGEIIEAPDQGWLEWLADGGVGPFKDFKIVHHQINSPRHPNENCYHYNQVDGDDMRMDMHLDSFTGEIGIASLVTWLHPDNHGVVDLGDWVEVFRRLHVSYYEEARCYWDDADADGFFEGANEIWPYLPSSLKSLVEEYRLREK